MAKLSLEEFKSKYNEKITDNDDLLIELLEDLSDSITDGESEELTSLKNEMETVKTEYENLKQKYKERFLDAVETDETPKQEDLEEKEVIDIKEI